MNTTEKFISDITSDIWNTIYKVFKKDNNQIILSDNLDLVLKNQEDNIYFIWNIIPGTTKTEDTSIWNKTYFYIDLDIKNDVEAILWVEIGESDILSYASIIKSYLEWHKLFNQWSYIVFSWGWLHIYYKHSKGINIPKDIYKASMRRLLREFDSFFEDTPWICSDKACINKARIGRLPWTHNRKRGTNCYILYEQPQDAKLIRYMAVLWAKELQEENEKKEKLLAVAIEERKSLLMQSWWKEQDLFYQEINSIPAYLIAQKVLPSYPYSWKKNFKNGKWWVVAYFYNEKTNTICNWGSRHFNWWTNDSCFSNFSIIKNFYSYSSAQTFEYFKGLLT